MSATPLAAQGSWSFVTTATAPPSLGPAVTYDSVRNVTVVAVVGNLGTGNDIQFWERGAGDWALRGATGASNWTVHHRAVAFDANRVRPVLAWTGEFLSAKAAWNGRAGQYARIR